MYFCMHFFICMFCACVFHVICTQYGGFTRKKYACNATIPVASTVDGK